MKTEIGFIVTVIICFVVSILLALIFSFALFGIVDTVQEKGLKNILNETWEGSNNK